MVRLIQGDAIDVLSTLDENSVDAVVTDPPYGLAFMGRTWDSFAGETAETFWSFSAKWARACIRVLKPGGHLVAFGGTRVYHRAVCGIEDAGFEIRDCLAWLYGSGFPKSLDVSKAIDKAAGAEREVKPWKAAPAGGIGLGVNAECPICGKWARSPDPCRCPRDNGPQTASAVQWSGWGTALKPAHEPIVLARKPLSESTVAANVLRWGTGGINVDGCRVATDDDLNGGAYAGTSSRKDLSSASSYSMPAKAGEYSQPSGRWPANVVLDETAAGMLDEHAGESQDGTAVRTRSGGKTFGGDNAKPPMADMGYCGSGGPSRFFYTAKASTSERSGEDAPLFGLSTVRNTHPTVKPLDLMRWLCTLITPPGGLILDPFTGSGTTGVAAASLGFGFIGIEREAEYVAIAESRIGVIATLATAPPAR